MLPIRTDSPVHSRPWINWLLIVFNIGVLIWQGRDPSLMANYQLNGHIRSLAEFLTYAFLHIGWLHLIFNMLVLFALGNNVNDRLGHVGYLAFYLAGGVFAGLGFLMGGGERVVGASGAVGAVMG